MTRDVVPQPVEPRGFLRRRRTDDPRPGDDATPVQAAPVPVVVPPLAVAPPAVAPPLAEPLHPAESDDLLRAKDSLLRAALRQCDELSTALLDEQHARHQEIERLTAENELLRDALAALNADALARQQELQEATPSVALPPQLPEQRVGPAAGPEHPDVAVHNARRRSERRAGPG